MNKNMFVVALQRQRFLALKRNYEPYINLILDFGLIFLPFSPSTFDFPQKFPVK
ncbi:MAG: hypothetical protein AAFV71_05060 [Cyanobacteria bacterium J06633_8]